MRIVSCLYVLVLFACWRVSGIEAIDDARAWDLLRDLKAHESGRLKLLAPDRSTIQISGQNVKIIASGEELSTAIDFGATFPVPKTGLSYAQVTKVLVDMEFSWPSSKGYLMLSFGGGSLSSGTGIIFMMTDIPEIRVGMLSSSSKSTKYSASAMGSGFHKLRLEYNVADETMSVLFDGKSMSGGGSSSAGALSLLGVGFESLEIKELKMQFVTE
jgi:hypothetical protein